MPIDRSIDRSIDGWMDGFDDIRIAVDGGRDILDGVRSQLPNKQRHGSRVESQSAVVLCLCVCVYNRSATKYCGRHKRRCTLAFNLGHHRTRKNFIGFLEKGRHPSRCTCSYIVVLLVLPGPPIPVLDRMGSLWQTNLPGSVRLPLVAVSASVSQFLAVEEASIRYVPSDHDGIRKRRSKYTETNTNLKLPERFLEKSPRGSKEITVASMFVLFGAPAVYAPRAVVAMGAVFGDGSSISTFWMDIHFSSWSCFGIW